MNQLVVTPKTRRLVALWASAALLLFSFGFAAERASAADPTTYTNSADTHILESAAKKNYGTVTSLGVGGDEPAGTGKDKSALLKWSLSTIPAGSKINSASVTLNVTNTSTQTYQAYELRRAWVESAATWLLYATGKSWQTAGAKGSLDRGTTVVGSLSPSTTGKQTFALSPALVQSWVDNPASNNGIIIASATNTDGFAFSSRETSTSSLRPQLTLNSSLDNTPPETKIDSGPSGTVSTSSTSFAFSSDDQGATFQCSLDGGAFASCSSPKSYTGLSEGSHTFQVKATDAAGNSSTATRTWTVDTVAPSVSIDSGPSGAVSGTSASFAFSSNDQGATFQCSLDGDAFASCSSPKSYTGLSEGSHTFSVRAIDAAGNTDPIPASTTWTVDAVAPDTTLDSGPSGTISVAEAAFAFSSEEGATFECRLDGIAYSACSSPKSYTNLSNGSHTFDVRATDAAGNVDASPASGTFSVDVPPPETTPPAAPTITEGTAEGSTDTDGMVDFAWTGAEAGGSFECSLDTGTPSYSACVSPKHYMGYPDGTYSFRVRQIDDAGNVGAAATRGFVSQTDTGGTSGDTDTDGISDANESCDMQWGPRANNGCPYAQSQDYDFDGILDANDPITGRESQDTGFGSNPRIKANCDVYAVNRVDPIAFAHHLHNQIGNTMTTNQSTGQSLFEAGRGTTSCDMPWLTSAGWFPVIENEPVRAVNIYYRAPGDERYVQNLPVGTELLTPNQSFRCNTGAGEEPFQETPDVIYECTDSFGIRLDFPDCIDLRYLYDHTRNAVQSNRGVCPSTHPYRIPRVNQLTMYANANGSVPNPLRVSAGVDEWGDWTSLHGDYFAAVQPEFNQTTEFGPSLIQYCIRESRGSATGPERCGQGN